MPDVACKQLVQHVPGNEFLDPPRGEQGAMPAASLMREGLAKRKVAELKAVAKELNVLFSASIKKDELINKILARSADGYSEQWAIREL